MQISAKLYINGYIGKLTKRELGSDEEAQFFTTLDLNRFLDQLSPDVKEITITINSAGGLCTEGFAMRDRLRELKAKGVKIITIGEGVVGSIATVPFLEGDERRVYQNTDFFIHNPFISLNGPMEADELLHIGAETKTQENRILTIYTEATGKSSEEIKPYMDRASSLTAKQALDLGFVTSIIGESVENKRPYRLVALLDNNKTQNKPMATFTEEQKGWFEKKFEGIERLFKNWRSGTGAKNLMLETKEGATLFYEGELKKDTPVFIDEEMTQPAPDDTYTTSEMVIVVAGGVVAEVTPAEAAAEATKEKEIENLKAELDTTKAALKSEQEKNAEASRTLNKIEKEYQTLKGSITIGGKGPKEKEQEFKGAQPGGHRLDGAAKNFKSQYGK